MWVLFVVMNENSGAWNRAVAAQIRAERAASGKTQREVITQSGIPKSTYLRLESGERKADADQLATLSVVFGLRMSVFFQRVEDRVETSNAAKDELEEGLSPSGRRALEKARAENAARLGDSVRDPFGRARADRDDGDTGRSVAV